MIRCLLALLLLSGSAVAQLAPPQVAPPPSSPSPASTLLPPPVALPVAAKAEVFTATNAFALQGYQENPAVIRRMVDALVLATTKQRDLRTAWRTLVQPKDRVGIKVATTGGRYFCTHPAVVESIVAGLELAGVPRSQVTVWDRSSQNLAAAGYSLRQGSYQVRGIDPPKGFDPRAKFMAPMLGQLIWGDLQFRGRLFGLSPEAREEQQLSNESHFARVLNSGFTKIINLPVLSDEPSAGLAGALYNLTVPNVDNNRRFVQKFGTSSIPDLYLDPRLGPKVVLHLMDALVAQYAAGPEFDPNYAANYRTLLASKDPVALDATGLALLENWRREAKLPPIGARAQWLQEAEVVGIGQYEESARTVIPLP